MSTCQIIDSTPGCCNWICYAGDTSGEVFEFLTDGVPWDMTGCTVAATARRSAIDAEVALTATCTAVDAAIGQWRVAWDPAAVRTLLAGSETWTGVWDLQVTDAGGGIATVVRGTLTARLDVTR